MALDGLYILLCAGAVAAADPTPPATKTDPDLGIMSTLAVQSAMQHGRELLLKSDYRAAIAALEAQLPNINGNQTYLKLLQHAYRGYIQQLKLTKKEDEAQRFLKCLAILDRSASLDGVTLALQSTSNQPSPLAGSVKTTPTIRLKSEDEPSASSVSLLSQAEKEYNNRHYREAKMLYEQANQSDRKVTENARERWAYCKLYWVVEQLNDGSGRQLPWKDLEQETRQAMELAPRLDYAKLVLKQVEERHAEVGDVSRAAPAVPVQHFARDANGWSIAETANFRIFHNQAREYAEQTAAVAEKTRALMLMKWFAGGNESWGLKCDIYLHATMQDYNRATGQFNSPGHSTIRMEGGRVVVRRIDLHCDDSNLLPAVLPHETTHVVLAGAFGEQLPPRWADEGMAVLTEPREKVDRHLSNLQRCRQDGTLFSVRELIEQSYQPQQDFYPEPRRIGAFYAQSVSVVDYLTSLRGPQVFSQFLMEGMRYGYEKALQRQYSFQNFGDLEHRWSEYAFRSNLRAMEGTR